MAPVVKRAVSKKTTTTVQVDSNPERLAFLNQSNDNAPAVKRFRKQPTLLEPLGIYPNPLSTENG